MFALAICTTPFAFGMPLSDGQGFASLMLSVGPDAETSADMPEGCNIQLFPDGEFAATDGRPGNDPHNATKVWRMDAAIAAALVAELAAHKTPRLLDYEHQTIWAERNGKPAPASGWMRNYTYVAGRGLFAWADWTEKAKAHIEAKEYRFISPVFSYCRKTGRIGRLFHAALTNFPALDGMAQVAASDTTLPDTVTAVMAGSLFSTTQTQCDSTEEQHMKDFLKKLAGLLGLSEDADETAVCTALAALRQKEAAAEAAAKAATEQGKSHLDAMAALTAQIAALTKRDQERDLDNVIAVAKREGKLTAALEAWARDLGSKDLAALTTFLDKVQPIDALKGGTQTDGKGPDGDGKGIAALTADEKYAADQLGMTHEDYAKAKEAK